MIRDQQRALPGLRQEPCELISHCKGSKGGDDKMPFRGIRQPWLPSEETASFRRINCTEFLPLLHIHKCLFQHGSPNEDRNNAFSVAQVSLRCILRCRATELVTSP